MKTTGVLPEALPPRSPGSPAPKLMPCRTPLGRGDLDSRSHSLAIPSCGQPLLLLHPFILDPISYVDQGCAEVHAASAREVATSAGDSLSNPSARINRASATALRSDRLKFRAVLAWLWAYLAWRTQIPRSIRRT